MEHDASPAAADGPFAAGEAVSRYLDHRTVVRAFGDAVPRSVLDHHDLMWAVDAADPGAMDRVYDEDDARDRDDRLRREREWPADRLRAQAADELVRLCLMTRERRAGLAALRAPAMLVGNDTHLLWERQAALATLRLVRPRGHDRAASRRAARLLATAVLGQVEDRLREPRLGDDEGRRARRARARLDRARDD